MFTFNVILTLSTSEKTVSKCVFMFGCYGILFFKLRGIASIFTYTMQLISTLPFVFAVKL